MAATKRNQPSVGKIAKGEVISDQGTGDRRTWCDPTRYETARNRPRTPSSGDARSAPGIFLATGTTLVRASEPGSAEPEV